MDIFAIVIQLIEKLAGIPEIAHPLQKLEIGCVILFPSQPLFKVIRKVSNPFVVKPSIDRCIRPRIIVISLVIIPVLLVCPVDYSGVSCIV